MKQGMEGNMFYVIESGEVEIMVKTAYEDPLTTPSGYLGSVINVLGPHNYFGERALITSEPRAASIRATQKTRCFAFNKEDIPSSSVLSGKKEATLERIMQVNSKYGTDVYDIDLISQQFEKASLANQERGSVNRPDKIRGVDTDEDVDYDTGGDYETDMPKSPIEASDQVISYWFDSNKFVRLHDASITSANRGPTLAMLGRLVDVQCWYLNCHEDSARNSPTYSKLSIRRTMDLFLFWS
jgi:CRP-like cAMP-binding protein